MRQVQQARGPGHSFVMTTLLLKAQNVRHNIRLILGGDDEVGMSLWGDVPEMT